MVSINNSVNTKTVYSTLTNAGHKSDSKKTVEKSFDNYTLINKDISSDKTKNANDINNAQINVKTSTNNKTAQSKAKNKAATLKKNTKYGNYTVVANATVSKNQTSFSIKDANGKKGSVSIKYGQNGSSRIEEININGVKTTKVYDKNGKLRQNTTVDSNKKTTTTNEYDSTGKINTSVVKDTKSNTIKYRNYYLINT